jgi:hypothetical protein
MDDSLEISGPSITGYDVDPKGKLTTSNVYRTYENAYFTDTTGGDEVVDWHRSQEWYFDLTPTPVPDNYCYVKLDKSIGYSDFYDGYWNGMEEKKREGDKVRIQADWHKWFHKEVDGVHYRCPHYRYYGGFSDDFYWLCAEDDHEWPSDLIEDNISYSSNDSLSGQGSRTKSWYNCIPY